MLKITHDSGFFSCNSLKLHHIVKYINKYKKLPDTLDCQEQFSLYKPHDKTKEDITSTYFDNSSITFQYSGFIDFHWLYQFIQYNALDFNSLIPLIRKYFSPSNTINDIINHLETKYSLVYTNLCVLYYRGNDKIYESKCSDKILNINYNKIYEELLNID